MTNTSRIRVGGGSMKTLESFKKQLAKDNIKVIENKEDKGFEILTVEEKIKEKWKNIKGEDSCGRTEVMKYSLSFVIKNEDHAKYEVSGSYATILTECVNSKEYTLNEVPILQKLAILEISGKWYLVEPFGLSYKKFDEVQKEKAKLLVENAKEVFTAGDFEPKNVVYFSEIDSFFFTDVHPHEDNVKHKEALERIKGNG